MWYCYVVQSVGAKKRGTSDNGTETSNSGSASKHPRLDCQPDGGSDDDHLGN